MASRTTQTVVHFSSAFRLPGFEAWQPAGDYRVDRFRGSSRLAWRRVDAFIHLPAIALQSSAQQMVQLSPAVDAALENDLG
ncbi:hypothetical protein [Mesorhizobium sp.]|uniref:hypothetical protein n=1 Tax=Mesorhizobium sp. TaxID=1871066 RepID=UPI000FE89056|nr:hypothetical protein [Mesorhizobium sp.]RWO16104.1 MAG: hypothetical protein EOS08_28055 [Mesorhizobium sp.]RWP19915.1 MAG: hypothetical protein EOR00_06580 [Mesorhizobium sp.]RWP22647.1 MAG: hypothetical protein EOR01_13175 [Mesorhizobium sp.]RWP68101.1 MAG: hypothetical protein EOR07_07675 [Mesorhizobium sp.]RWP94109.1 MAG: hypothetical protein EOR89_31750 [Mesorhizobium sp.]